MGENGASFVVPSIPKFNGHYDHWARLMENFIRSKEYWDLIGVGIAKQDGVVQKEAQKKDGVVLTEAQRKVVAEQTLRDLKLKNFLYQSIDMEILDTILNTDTSKQIWDSMKQKYQGSTKVKRAQLQALRVDFETLRMKEGESINNYFARTLAIAKKMKACGGNIEETTVTEKIMRSLSTRFNYVICAIEESNNIDTLTLDELQSSLLVHEQRMQVPSEVEQVLKVTEENENVTRGRGSYRGSYRGRGGRGRGRSNRATTECYKCHKLGHYAYECPSWEKSANYVLFEEKEELLLMALVEKEGSQEEDVWYLDSGCSNHMTGEKKWFITLNEECRHSVKLGNNARMKVEGKGNARLLINGRTHVVSDVYYVPDLNTNLLSIGQLQEKQLTVLIKDDSCKIFHQKWGLIMSTRMASNRMFMLSAQVPSSSCLQALLTIEEISKLWHQRFGHLNFESLYCLSKKQMVRDLPAIKRTSCICETCTKGKQHREPIPKVAKWRASEQLELVHSDICGPISPSSNGNKRYMLTFIDDFSRKTWIYFLSEKGEALTWFKRFKIMVESDSGKKIRSLRTDRGGEFNSKTFDDFCANNGIKRQLTTAYTPQQNGVAERKNRTIMNMVRCLLKEKNMPKRYWAEAANWASHILNRCSTSAVKNRTPQECWSNTKPSVDYFKIFGCIGYVHIPRQIRVKLDDKSQKCIFLGVSEESKAYKMYDPLSNKVIISRDVIFDEQQCWDWERTQKEETDDMLIVDDEVNDENEDAEGDDNHGSSSGSQGTQDTSSISSENSSQEEEGSIEAEELGPGKRITRAPRHLQDFVSGEGLSDEENVQHLAMFASNENPLCYEEAVKSDKWRVAMDLEIHSIEKNQTWELAEVPKGVAKIGVKWIYKTKVNERGEIDKYKARLVAKGYAQKHGIDYDEVFAPVARWDTIRMLIAVAAQNQWTVFQLDVKSAFLYGELKETVYVEQPPGYVKLGEEHKAYKLKKALYGLKQAPRAWYSKIEEYLLSNGFNKCSHEHTLFTKVNAEGDLLIVSIYVDDLIFTGNNPSLCDEFKSFMEKKFDMTDLGRMHYFLGVEVQQTTKGIFLSQKKYASEVIARFGMEGCNPVSNPMVPGTKFSKDDEGEAVDPSLYKQLIGCLMYLTTTRPDIMFPVCYLSRFMSCPKEAHLTGAKRVLRYIKGSTKLGLFYMRSEVDLFVGYTDSDFAGDVDSSKSTSGYVFIMSNAAVAWSSRKQPIVTLSTTEAEYVAACACACQSLWMKKILESFNQSQYKGVTIYCDNTSSIKLSKNPIFHGRTKHIKVRFHFLRDLVKEGEIDLLHCKTENQRADIMTKPLSLDLFLKMRELLGVKEYDGAN
ncbi:unnamed protein product [Rhodiola kirilowii]